MSTQLVYNPFSGVLDYVSDGGGGSTTSGNRVLIQTINANNNATIDFVTGITGYDLYEIDFYGVKTAGATDQQLVFSNDAGATWQTSNYNSANIIGYPNTGGFGGFTGQSELVICTTTTDDTSLTFNGNFKFQNLGSNTLAKSVMGASLSEFSGGLYYLAAGYWVGAAPVNGIRFTPDTGVYSSGTFKLYGIQN